MNTSCKELKRLARENLTHHYGIPMGALLVAGIIPLAIDLPFSMVQGEHPTMIQNITFYIAECLIALISFVLSAGVSYLHLNIARRQPCSLKMVFYGFRNHPDRFLLAGLLQGMIGLICMIPGIAGAAAAYYSRSAGAYLLCALTVIVSVLLAALVLLGSALFIFFLIDKPGAGVVECLRNSFHTMHGSKGRLLYMYLSFLGLGILNLFSLGIGGLWIAPYQSQTVTLFYMDVTGEHPQASN